MKKLLCIPLFLYLISVSVFAHPGRTDSNGGHYNRSTGEYHYHTGEYAGRSQSSSSTSFDNSNFRREYEKKSKLQEENTQKEESASETKKETSDFWGNFVLCLIAGWFLLGGIFPFLKMIYDEFICQLLPRQRLSDYEISINKLKYACQELDKLQETLNISSVNSKPPSDVIIGEDGLPKEEDAEDWGESFTGYVSPYGRKIHFKRGCGNAFRKTHLYHYRDACCLNCYRNISVPDLSWYGAYLKSKEIELSIEREKGYILSTKKELFKNHKRCNSKFLLLFFSKTAKEKLKKLNKQYFLLLELSF